MSEIDPLALVMRARSALANMLGLLMSGWTAWGCAARKTGHARSGGTKASIIYRASGNLRAVQLLLGHAKIEKPSAQSWCGCGGCPGSG
jgi:hypothetical protein